MFRGIHWRIALIFTILVIVVMVGLNIFLSNMIRSSGIEALSSELIEEAELIRYALELGDQLDAPAGVMDSFAMQWAEQLDVRVTIIGRDGVVEGESSENREKMDNHGNRPEFVQAMTAGKGTSIRFSNTLGVDMVYAAVRVGSDETTQRVVRLSSPLSQVQARTNDLRNALIVASMIAVSVVFLISVYISDRTTMPLRELTLAAQRVSAGLDVEFTSDITHDEIGDLARAFNTMARYLKTQIYALKSEQTKMTAMMEQMRNGVMIIDPNGLVVLYNQLAARMFGIKQDEVVGDTLVSVLRHHRLVEIWKESVASGKAETLELDLPRQNRFLEVVAAPMGEPLLGHTILLFQDMTRVRQLETIRKDFISNVSHELRTPLASLKALAETLLSGALEDPPAASRFLSQIETEVDSLSLMVQELLELSRIESGRVPLQMRAVSPCQLINAAHERLHLQVERAGLVVELNCPEDLPQVLADPTRIEQVLMNLLHNAVKFTPKGGQIQMAVYEPDMPASGRRELIFEVRDTGTGIATDDLPRIFERFFKSDRARAGGGTGLGLAIVRHMVELHGGRIWVHSEEGKGSSFFFSLFAQGPPKIDKLDE